MKLSIIVPIHNVAPYLRKCVDSLLAQDYVDYEIILVDDGSTDNSGAIANEIVSEAIGNRQWAIDEDTNSQSPIANRATLRVIHQENMGLSEARNTGTRAAQGEYIMYVDSDDYLEPNVLGALMEQVELDQLDVLRFRYQNVRESGETFAPYKDMTNYNDYSSTTTDGLTFLNERMGTQCYAVQFILRRELALQEQFTPGIYFEDTDWTPRMLLQAKRVASSEIIAYNYLWREGSITKAITREKQQKVLNDKIHLIGSLQLQSASLKKLGVSNNWFIRMISATVVSIISILGVDFYAERHVYLSKLKQMNVLPIYASSLKAKLINISPSLAIELIHLKNKK